MASQVVIALGSSIEPKAEFIDRALTLIAERIGRVLKKSSLLKNPAVGPNASNEFINAASLIETDLTPEQVLQELLKIETELGRERELHWGDRTIDLDIIQWQNSSGSFEKRDHEDLQIPHPRAAQRDFVLVPMKEVAPEWIESLPKQSTINPSFRRCGASESSDRVRP